MDIDSDFHPYFVTPSVPLDCSTFWDASDVELTPALAFLVDIIMNFLVKGEKRNRQLHSFESICLPRCFVGELMSDERTPVWKIACTYPNTRSCVKPHQIPNTSQNEWRAHHGTNDSNSVGNEVLGNSQYD